MELFFEQCKEKITPFLDSYLAKQQKNLNAVNGLADDTFNRLRAFVGKGKMVRGGLVYLAYALANKKPDVTCLTIASAMEMVHAALLVHDDIMDKDIMRRGEPTLFRQYQLWTNKQGSKDSDHLGESLGICAGDILIFLCFDLLSSLPAKTAKINSQLVSLFSQELSMVGLAQMQDVFSGSTNKPAHLTDIKQLYRYKTARYTFSLPLMLGSIAAKQKPKTISTLETIGELLGYIFQLRDDELGIMGSEEKIGKPVGSDIRENKKTLYHFYLFQKVSGSERKKLSNVFGNSTITKQDISYVHSLLHKYSIPLLVQNEQLTAMKTIDKLVKSLSLRQQQMLLLEKLITYNTKRTT